MATIGRRIAGTIDRKDPHTCVIISDDGDRFFAYKLNFDTFSGPWADIKVGNRVSFLIAPSDRRKDDDRAIEIRVIDRSTLDGL